MYERRKNKNKNKEMHSEEGEERGIEGIENIETEVETPDIIEETYDPRKVDRKHLFKRVSFEIPSEN